MSIDRIVDVLKEALEEFAQEVRDDTLREVESNLRVAVGGKPKGKPGRKPGRLPKVVTTGKKRGRPTKVTAARRLQGRYMGMLRAFNMREKAGFKRIREEKGTEAAIAAMEKANGDGAAPKAKPRKAAKKATKPVATKPVAAAKDGTVRGKLPKGNVVKSLAEAVAKASKDAAKDAPSTPQGA